MTVTCTECEKPVWIEPGEKPLHIACETKVNRRQLKARFGVTIRD